MTIQMMAFSVKNFQKSYKGWIRKSPRIHPSYHCGVFTLKNYDLGLKINET